MKDIMKQAQAYARLALTNVPVAERHTVLKGASVFFRRGWPIDHFTVGMAARAGMGLVPPVYQGSGSEELYFQSTKDGTEGSSIDMGEKGAKAKV